MSLLIDLSKAFDCLPNHLSIVQVHAVNNEVGRFLSYLFLLLIIIEFFDNKLLALVQ